MSTQKPLTVSIVIPVYNEERYLAACLRSIAAQTVRPDEVIVVDNNCRDRSMAIAREFGWVTIIQEPRQHQAYAQASGFNATHSDILGRIDADTILPRDWVAVIRRAFEQEPAMVGISGGGIPYDLYAQKLTAFLIDRFYRLAAVCAGHTMLWGSNCAIRRSAWLKIQDRVLLRADIWEDFDVAFCLAPYGRIKTLPGLRVGFSLRSTQLPFLTQFRYQLRAVRTYRARAGWPRTVLFSAVWLSMLSVYPMTMLDRLIRKVRGKP